MRFGVGHQRRAKELLNSQSGAKRFQIQILKDNIAIAKRLWPSMSSGKFARSPDAFDRSILWRQAVPPLHLASLLALSKTVSILLAHIPEVSIDQEAMVNLLPMSGNSQTALHCAVRSKSLVIVELLLNKGANIEAGANSEDGAPLYLASSLGYLPIVERLISWRANVNAKGGPCGQQLQAACARGRVDVAKLLLAFGADVDASENYDGSALCAAANRGDESLINLLLDHGAKINDRVQHCGTALHIASNRGYGKIVQLLLYRGADIAAMTEDGFSALDLAIIRMRKEVVELFIRYGAGIPVEQSSLIDTLFLLEQTWHNFCEDWECTDEDDVAHFEQVRECKEGIEELLTHVGVI